MKWFRHQSKESNSVICLWANLSAIYRYYTMYFWSCLWLLLLLLLCSIGIHSCLPSDNYDYSELDTELDWDASSELNGNGTDAPFNDIDETTIDVHLIESTVTINPTTTTNTTKNITIDEQLTVEAKLLELSGILKSTIHRIRKQFKKLDIVFLIDSSSSVGKSNFRSELRFVIKFLSDFNVSFNYTRVSIVTFSSQEKIVCISHRWHPFCILRTV